MRTSRRGSVAAVGAALALLLAVLGAGLAPTAQAQPRGATLTIHNRLCPAGYAGTNYFRDCHGRSAGAGLEFFTRGAQRLTRTTGADGNVTFALQPGRYTVRGGVPGEFATLRVFCAPAAKPGTPFPITILRGGTRGPSDPTGIRLALAAGDSVVCDWYNTPESQR